MTAYRAETAIANSVREGPMSHPDETRTLNLCAL